MLEPVLDGPQSFLCNLAPPAYPSAGTIGASLVVKRPITVAPSREGQGCSKETDRDRPRIAHEEARGRKVEQQERGARGRHDDAFDRQGLVAAHPGAGPQERETRDR